MNKLLLIILSAAMSIQTPLPAAKPNDKKNRKKQKKLKKMPLVKPLQVQSPL